jgi:hypothetical protein
MNTPTEAKVETKSALSFMLAGNATFTLRSGRTGARYTYKVQESKDRPGVFFVKYLTGPDNENDYRYLGMIVTGGKPGESTPTFRLTAKSKEHFTLVSLPVSAFDWVLSKLAAGVEPPNVEIWHAGKCGRCGRTLTVPESIQLGLGSECASRL